MAVTSSATTGLSMAPLFHSPSGPFFCCKFRLKKTLKAIEFLLQCKTRFP